MDFLTNSPYEIIERIVKYISDDDIVNFSLIDVNVMKICDEHFKREAIKCDIPIELLPKNNVTKKYVRLHNYKSYLEKDFSIDEYIEEFLNQKQYNELCMDDDIGEYIKEFLYGMQYGELKGNDHIESLFKDSIDNNDIKMVGWLMSLMIKSNILDSIKIRILCASIIYAFMNNNDEMGKLLSLNLHEIKSDVISSYGDKITTFLSKVINYAVDKDKIDILYYILDNISDLIPNVRFLILQGLAIKNDINNMTKLINNYIFTWVEYNKIIVDTTDINTLDFLLQHYPDTNQYLNYIAYDLDRFLTKDFLACLFKYGYDDYDNLLRILSLGFYECNDSDKCETIRWILFNYGHKISLDRIKTIYKSLSSDIIKKEFCEHLSSRNIVI